MVKFSLLKLLVLSYGKDSPLLCADTIMSGEQNEIVGVKSELVDLLLQRKLKLNTTDDESK